MGSVKDILEKYIIPDTMAYEKDEVVAEAEAELNQHYLKVFMDLIGEDGRNLTTSNIKEVEKDVRNELKAELRQQAKKLLGESDPNSTEPPNPYSTGKEQLGK